MATSWFFSAERQSPREQAFGNLLLACISRSDNPAGLLPDFCSQACGLGEHCGMLVQGGCSSPAQTSWRLLGSSSVSKSSVRQNINIGASATLLLCCSGSTRSHEDGGADSHGSCYKSLLPAAHSMS